MHLERAIYRRGVGWVGGVPITWELYKLQFTVFKLGWSCLTVNVTRFLCWRVYTSLIANAGLPRRITFSFLKGTELGWLVSRRSFPPSKGECSDHCGWDYER